MAAFSTLGSYRLVAELGHGGMADVFLTAVQGPVGSGFTKLAVVKKLRENLAEDPDFVAMLMDEARITARLAHPNVVQLIEVGHEQGQYFLAIEYLDGQPLHRIDRRAKRLGIEVPRVLHYAVIADVLAGLHYAHELSDYDGTALDIVHRDVTPHNVFVTYDGAVKVVDFGIAKALGRTTETQHGVVKGKVRYMSPEQATGGDVDRRTDIFAAGVILWNSATGMKLWGELDEIGIVKALVNGTYRASPRAACADVPEEIDRICRRALAHAPEDRYVTAAEMRADLEAFLGRGSADARKKLESTMKQLFANERTKLRAVLEGAGLNTVASMDAFTAGVAAQRSSELATLHDSEPPGPGQFTQLMPNAPPRPYIAPAPPAAARDALSRTPTPDGFAGAEGQAHERAAARAKERPRFLGKSAFAMAALAAVVTVVGVRAQGRGVEGAAERARAVSEITPVHLTLASTTRAKAERAAEVDVPHGKPILARRAALPEPQRSAAQPVTAAPPRPERAPAPAASAKPASSAKIDNSDPWGQ